MKNLKFINLNVYGDTKECLVESLEIMLDLIKEGEESILGITDTASYSFILSDIDVDDEDDSYGSEDKDDEDEWYMK